MRRGGRALGGIVRVGVRYRAQLSEQKPDRGEESQAQFEAMQQMTEGHARRMLAPRGRTGNPQVGVRAHGHLDNLTYRAYLG